MGAKVARCKDDCVLKDFLLHNDELLKIDGVDVTSVPTAEIKHLLARNPTSSSPFRVLEFGALQQTVTTRPKQ